MRTLSPKFALFTWLLPIVRAQICDVVECRNGGICVEEEGDFSGHYFGEDETVVEEYGRGSDPFHCRCAPGWTGRVCDIPYSGCSDTHIC